MRSHDDTETIFALSSGRLPAGVAVVRVSGPAAFAAVASLSGPLPEPRVLSLRSIRTLAGDLIDRGLVAVFPGPASFTGEDCVELHLHGGRAVVAAVSRELANIPSLRMAEAGEFSLRAFTNGKFDLTTAEALADLIEAETEAQHRFAIDNANGRNSLLYDRWRETLLNARAMIEAELDFPEEEDIPGSVSVHVWHSIESMLRELERHLASYRHSEIIREGYRVAIVGPPNAGKSSLLNVLANRDVAIVSDEPGTTRDLVEVQLNLNGLKVILTDTAGIRADAGAVEQEGIRRARAVAERADLVLLLDDHGPGPASINLATTVPVLRIRTKIDLVELRDSRETETADLCISVLSGEGMNHLTDMIGSRAGDAVGSPLDAVPFRERHVAELAAARAGLEVFLSMRYGQLELAAEQLRQASNSLARIVGAIDVEDMLDTVFSRFCIGK